MSKKDLIWRHILHEAIDNKKYDFTQKDLAEKLDVSLSTVFSALKIPRAQGAIKVTGRNFSVIDKEKFLYIWATQRNMEKEIIYKTFTKMAPKEIEGMMPAGIVYGAYSAYVQKFSDAPADYDKVYVYAGQNELEEIKKRFPKAKGNNNLFVLKLDQEEKDQSLSNVRIFSDFWNMKDWYAKDFLNKLKEQMNLE